MKGTARLDVFWSRVDKSGDCWLWQGHIFPGGYGAFWYNGNNRTAHRFAYIHERGPIPNDLVLDHLCRNRACVKPSHLEAVTNRTNLLRGVGFVAVNAAKTHCIHGHEFTDTNTYLWQGKRGTTCRSCRQCRDDARRKSAVA